MMKANEIRKIAIESAQKEITQIEKQIYEAAKNCQTTIILKDISNAALAYFEDNEYKIEKNKIDLSQERTIIGFVKISW